MKHDFYEITWIDSESEIGWDAIENLKSSKGNIRSYGFLIKLTDEFLTLASDIDKNNKHYNRFIHIPNVCVLKQRKIKI